MLEVEADCYWCLCKLVEAIQDHYTYAQPGIQRAVFRLQRLVRWADKAASLAHSLYMRKCTSVCRMSKQDIIGKPLLVMTVLALVLVARRACNMGFTPSLTSRYLPLY